MNPLKTDPMMGKANEKRQKDLKELITATENYQRTKAVEDGLKEIHFNKRREQYRTAHESDFNIHFAAKRTLDRLLKDHPDKTLHIRNWKEEAERLSTEYAADYEELKKQREESYELFRIQTQIDSVLKAQGITHAQKSEQFPKQETPFR